MSRWLAALLFWGVNQSKDQSIVYSFIVFVPSGAPASSRAIGAVRIKVQKILVR